MNQASPAHAQRHLPVGAAGLVDGGGHRQEGVADGRVVLSVLRQEVAHIFREGQSGQIHTVTSRRQDQLFTQHVFYLLWVTA